MWEQTEQFWAERDAWAVAVEARQSAAGGAKSLTLTHKKARWKLQTKSYMRYAPTGAYKNWMSIDADFSRTLMSILTGLADGLADAADQQFAAVMMAAFQKWPVSSGLSKSMLDISYTDDGNGHLVAMLSSTAQYTIYIKNKPHVAYIKRPGIEAGKLVAQAGISSVSIRNGG